MVQKTLRIVNVACDDMETMAAQLLYAMKDEVQKKSRASGSHRLKRRCLFRKNLWECFPNHRENMILDHKGDPPKRGEEPRWGKITNRMSKG